MASKLTKQFLPQLKMPVPCQISVSSCPLTFIVVGAGLGGLSASIGLALAGHKVTVLEQAAQLKEVGAGIQIPPNSTKILEAFGCKDEIVKQSTLPHGCSIYNYKGKKLSHTPLNPEFKTQYGAEYLHIHRADFHQVLANRAYAVGVKIVLNAHAERIDFSTTTVYCSDNTSYTADVIIGADGLKSKIRTAVLGYEDPPKNTGDLAYRALLPIDELYKHPELEYIYKEPNIKFIWGPNMHIVIYLLKGGSTCNLVVLAPDNLPEDAPILPAEDGELTKVLQGWDPRLVKLVSLVHQTTKWRLQNSKELENWCHKTANVALLGDSCHATLPYLAQGAAQAVEDGGALAYLFGKIQSRDQIHGLLLAYENMRKWRTTQIVQGSSGCQKIYHLEDGPKQQARDELCEIDPPQEGCPNRFGDPVFQKFMYGYDVFAESEKAWREFAK